MSKFDYFMWEEVVFFGLVNFIVYWQLIFKNGVVLKFGDMVFIWGAFGGFGSYVM